MEYCLQNKTKNFWIAQTKNRLQAMQHSAESIFIIEHLREYEFIFETALTHESGGPGESIDEKNWGSKISWHCPFKFVQNFSFNTKV
jgi:hypothetical protein